MPGYPSQQAPLCMIKLPPLYMSGFSLQTFENSPKLGCKACTVTVGSLKPTRNRQLGRYRVNHIVGVLPRKGSYTQGATFDKDGKFKGRTDVTDHGRGDHANPHWHPAKGPNSVEKGGSEIPD